MPVLVRRRPSLDLRKAARAAEHASKFGSDPLTFDDAAYDSRPDVEMDIPKHKLANLPSRQKSRANLRLVTSSPVLHQLYQSDEEQASPSPDNGSEYLSCDTSSEEEESALDSEEDFDFEDDFDTPIALPIVFVAAAEAVAVPIRSVGRPSMVDVPVIAPMAKRTVPISRPESASYTTFRKFKAPSPTTVRASVYLSIEAPKPSLARNFSTPLQRSQSDVPSHSYSGSSPSSSIPSLGSQPPTILDIDEADLLMRESDEIMDRSKQILAGTEWDLAYEGPKTRTSYEDYDPFALQPPVLVAPRAPYSVYNEPETPGKTKAWSKLGFRSRLMAAGRKVSNL